MDSSVQNIIDNILTRLMSEGHLRSIEDSDLVKMLDFAAELCRPLPSLIELDAPITIFGDIHGHFADLQKFFQRVGYPSQSSANFLFLGDYVDRGSKGLEVAVQLICFKCLFPDKISLLRGNHEDASINRVYGFYNECRRKRSVFIWKKIQSVFNELPLAASISNKILAMHGGLSPDIVDWDSLKKLKKPRCVRELDTGITCDLIWADPCDCKRSERCKEACICIGWRPNTTRKTSFFFGENDVKEIRTRLGIDLVVRGHELPKNKKGYRFSPNHSLCTIFSAFHYSGGKNQASIMQVSSELKINIVSFVKKKKASFWKRKPRKESRSSKSNGEDDDEITIRSRSSSRADGEDDVRLKWDEYEN